MRAGSGLREECATEPADRAGTAAPVADAAGRGSCTSPWVHRRVSGSNPTSCFLLSARTSCNMNTIYIK